MSVDPAAHDPAWRNLTGEMTEIELPMIEVSGDDIAGVRLWCQIPVTPQLDGLIPRAIVRRRSPLVANATKPYPLASRQPRSGSFR